MSESPQPLQTIYDRIVQMQAQMDAHMGRVRAELREIRAEQTWSRTERNLAKGELYMARAELEDLFRDELARVRPAVVQGRERTTPRPVAEPTAPEATSSTSTASIARGSGDEALPTRLLGLSEDLNATWRELHRLQARVAELKHDTAFRERAGRTALPGPSDKPPERPDR